MDDAGGDLEGADLKRYVIVGLSRLSVRVAKLLSGPDTEIIVIAAKDELELHALVKGLAACLESGPDRVAALEDAGLAGAACLLALSEDDMDNLNTAVAARAIAPEVPVVLRAFDPALADQLQGLNIRRAYSVSALAAPAFVAAALSDELVQSFRLGDDDVILLRLTVRPGSPMLGHTAAEVKRESGCAVIARAAAADGGEAWRPASLDERLDVEGERVIVGGPLRSALRVAIRNEGLHRRSKRVSRLSLRAPKQPHLSEEAVVAKSAVRKTVTLLPMTAAILVGLILATIVVFGVALHLDPIEAAYFAVSTTLGNSTLDQSDAWLKVVGVASMILGGALIGVVFSWLASVATAQRLEQRMGRRARELSGHAVVVGLGTVGYRVERLLHEMGIPTALIDRDPDARFAGAVGERTPVLTGDVRLAENLERLGIRRARWLLACTSDDLTNIEACLSARRLNPEIRTVARIFEEDLAERVGGSFGVDMPISASLAAAGAFAGAATDERAFRSFRLGDLDYLAFRYVADRVIDVPEIERWRGGHVRILAFRRSSGRTQPPSELADALVPGDSAILAGPADAIRTLVLDPKLGEAG
jgi:Trk K+ transport system NAD-binding subunit